MPSETHTSRVTIAGTTYPAAFVLLPNSSRDVILGIVCLTDNGSVIDMQTNSITFFPDHSMTPEPNSEHHGVVSIANDCVTLPPRTSFMVTVYFEDAAPDAEAIVESDQSLLLDRGVSVGRGIAGFRQRQSHILVSNFTEEYQHLNKDVAIAFVEEAQEASDVIVVAEF